MEGASVVDNEMHWAGKVMKFLCHDRKRPEASTTKRREKLGPRSIAARPYMKRLRHARGLHISPPPPPHPSNKTPEITYHRHFIILRSLDLLYALRELVYPLTRVVSVHVCVFRPEVPPLKAVDGTKVALLALSEPQPTGVFFFK